jgi:hypothetical protein
VPEKENAVIQGPNSVFGRRCMSHRRRVHHRLTRE